MLLVAVLQPGQKLGLHRKLPFRRRLVTEFDMGIVLVVVIHDSRFGRLHIDAVNIDAGLLGQQFCYCGLSRLAFGGADLGIQVGIHRREGFDVCKAKVILATTRSACNASSIELSPGACAAATPESNAKANASQTLMPAKAGICLILAIGFIPVLRRLYVGGGSKRSERSPPVRSR